MTVISTDQGWCVYGLIGPATLRITEHRSSRIARIAYRSRVDAMTTIVSPDGLRRVECLLAPKVSEFAVWKMCDHLGVPMPATFLPPAEPGSNQQNEEQSA